MPTRSLQRLLGVLLLPAALLAPAAFATDLGFPLIQSYVSPIPEVEPQNFEIARDPRGVLYIANDAGVVVYDGAWWRRIPIGKRASAFAVSSDANGRIAVGGIDDLGLLEPDSRGTLRYVSLLDKLPPGDRDLGQIFRIYPTRQGFSYMAQSRLLLWNGSRLTTVARFPPGRPYPVSFRVDDQIYVWCRDGIFRLAGERLQPVPGGEIFRGRRVDQILPARPGLLVSVREEGLFLLRDGHATPFAPAASSWARQSRVYSGLLLPDGRWALGSVVGGLLLLRPDGAIDQVIDSQRGLPNDFVFGMVLDREGALWLALNSGLVRVEITSPLSTIDGRTGLRGSAYTVERHRGALWVGTGTGLFTNLGTDGAGESGPPLRMRAVPGLPPGVWSLLSAGDDLLAGSAGGLYRVGLSGVPERISPPDVNTVYVLKPSVSDPDRVWVGTVDGLGSVRRQGGVWRWEGKIATVPVEVRSIVESRGVLWCGTVDDLVGLRLPLTGAPPAFRTAGGKTEVFTAGGGLMAVRDSHVFRLDETRGRLVEDAALTRLAGGSLNALVEDAEGNLWMDTRPPSVAVRQGDVWSLRALPEIPARGVEAVLAEPDGTVWLAGETQIFRYEGKLRKQAATPPSSPLLGRLTEGSRLLFGGAPGVSPGLLELPYNARRLRIEFAPLSFRAGLRYQTRLEPLDATWSAPTAEPFAELARIPPGEYTFHVRTLGPGGIPGPETSWPFHVKPPWYQSFWALALWLALALLVVRGYIEIRERTLRQRAARLESRVQEQTVELRGKVEELGRAHADLAAANARLEEISQRDELTGIANRRRLQQALDSEWSHTRQAIAFILIDLDSFKLLNDTQGHLAGDLCLQAVAGLVDREARRQGGLAARYGGEELAVLLPGVNLPTALEIAEHLRRGIEGLAIPHPSAPLGKVTASLGVATLDPNPGGSAEDLIEAADMALYRAKAEGKNRVAAGGVRQGKGASENPAA